MTIPHPDGHNPHTQDHWSQDPEVAKYDPHSVRAALLAKSAIGSIQPLVPTQHSSAVEHPVSVYEQLAGQIASSGLSTIDQIALLETALNLRGQQERTDANANANLALAALAETKLVSEHVANVNWNSVSLVPQKPRRFRFSKNR